jgi:hypothetical protein
MYWNVKETGTKLQFEDLLRRNGLGIVGGDRRKELEWIPRRWITTCTFI